MSRASTQYRLWLADLLNDQVQRLTRSTISVERTQCLRRMKILVDKIDGAILCATKVKLELTRFDAVPDIPGINTQKNIT